MRSTCAHPFLQLESMSMTFYWALGMLRFGQRYYRCLRFGRLLSDFLSGYSRTVFQKKFSLSFSKLSVYIVNRSWKYLAVFASPITSALIKAWAATTSVLAQMGSLILHHLVSARRPAYVMHNLGRFLWILLCANWVEGHRDSCLIFDEAILTLKFHRLWHG